MAHTNGKSDAFPEEKQTQTKEAAKEATQETAADADKQELERLETKQHNMPLTSEELQRLDELKAGQTN